MGFYQVINNRRTVRDLTAEPISADVLERIIAAGIQAPAYDYRREENFGLGYPKENSVILEQVERPVKSTLHFGIWENGGIK